MSASEVWDILVEHCGASERDRAYFVGWVDDGASGEEFRFVGSLGFGGKVYMDRPVPRVSCYREDETPERLAMIERANQLLGEVN